MEIRFGYKSIDLDDCIIVDNTRNFSGKEKKNRFGKIVNGEGRRNFLVELSEDQFHDLKDRGWDVGVFGAEATDRDPTYFIRVNVSWYKASPKIHYISEGIDTLLDESRVGDLDFVNFERLGVRCEQANKQKEDGSWIKKPFVRELWAEVTPDRFRARYANLQRAAQVNDSLPAEGEAEDDGELPF